MTVGFDHMITDLINLVTSPIGFIGALAAPNSLPSFKKMNQRIKNFRATCGSIIAEKRKEFQDPTYKKKSKVTDLVQLLLGKQAEGGENAITDEEIIDEFMTFFLAGMDTTAHLMSMTLYYLQRNAHVREEVLQEIATHYSENATIENLNKMELLGNVFKETLRVVPPGPMMFMREAVNDHVLNNIQIKKGTLMNVDLISHNFNPKYFDEPEKYNPNRWVNFFEQTKGDGFCAIQFSAGPRNCIGQHLAMHEAKIILSEFLLRFNYELREGYQLKLGLKQLYQPTEDLKYKLTSIKRN